ncbi:hypothetical protein ACVWYG_000491 [Pedobacter sp. UYEF25]
MIKYVSYFNLFIGIILLALSKNNQNALDFLSLLPILLFNWLSLFHLLKSNLKFAKWHIWLGYICIFLSVLSVVADGILLAHIFSPKNTPAAFSLLLVVVRLVFDISVVFQVFAVLKFDRNLRFILTKNQTTIK